MRNTRIIMFAIAVTCIASIGASSTASAASWKVAGTLLNGSAALATTANVTEQFEMKFSSVTIKCHGVKLEAVAPQITHPDSMSFSNLTFSECEATGGNCFLEGTTMKLQPTTALAQTVSSTALAIFKPKTKTVFANFSFLGEACAFAEAHMLATGQVLATSPTGATENTLQALAVSTPSGEVKVGSSSATILGEAQFKLASGSPWSFR